MRKGAAAVGCVASIATFVVACGNDHVSAGTKVERAVNALAEQKAVTMTAGFDGSEQQIWSAMKREKDFTHDDAKVLAGLDVSLSVSSKKPLKDTKGKDGASVAVRVATGPGDDVLEFRSVSGDKAYVRVDLKKIMSLVSDAGDAKSAADMKEFRSFLDSADKLPASYRSVKDALAGKWVSIDPKAYEEFSKSLGKDAGASPFPDTGSLDLKTQQKMAEAIRKAVGSNARFADAGSRDGADHVKVTVPARKTAAAVAEALKPMEKQLPKDFKLSDLKDAPNKNVTFDVAIKDGMLSGATVDLAQFDKKPHGKLPLSLAFTADAKPVSAPAGASTLNPQDVMGAMMQLMMGQMGKPGQMPGMGG